MIKLGVHSTPAVFEPRATATATTNLAGFLDFAAFAAYESRTDTCCRSCCRSC